MALFPFSEMGVSGKLNEIYNLPGPDVLVQAEQIKNDFIAWISNSFALSLAQLQYLNHLSEEVAGYYGQQCAFCFINRLPIVLVYPEAPSAPGYTKWTVVSDSIRVGTDGDGNSEITGTLTFTMIYR